VPGPGPGVCAVCRGPASRGQRICFACRTVARRLGLPLAPVLPARLCPLPSPLYTVLLGYKESPVAEARLRFGAIVRALLQAFAAGGRGRLEALAGAPFDLVSLVPSTHRPGPAPLGRVAGLDGAMSRVFAPAQWTPDLLQRNDAPGGPPPVAHMRPDPAAFSLLDAGSSVAGACVLLLDDTYVSGARAQSAAATLQQSGARATVIAPLGRVLRPDRVALHAEFLARHSV
jgi:hypothetical protein